LEDLKRKNKSSDISDDSLIQKVQLPWMASKPFSALPSCFYFLLFSSSFLPSFLVSLELQTFLGPGVHVDWVAGLRAQRILLPDLDRLVRLTRHQPTMKTTEKMYMAESV